MNPYRDVQVPIVALIDLWQFGGLARGVSDKVGCTLSRQFPVNPAANNLLDTRSSVMIGSSSKEPSRPSVKL